LRSAVDFEEKITMFRRRFLQLLAVSGAGTLALEARGSGLAKTVVFQVKGFSCITCAAGLDTVLTKEKGILSSKSTYPEGKVTVKFDSDAIDETSIRSLIAEMGFTVENQHAN
jgi:copper chaperone CopZ